jgi:hypothetical protein
MMQVSRYLLYRVTGLLYIHVGVKPLIQQIGAEKVALRFVVI